MRNVLIGIFFAVIALFTASLAHAAEDEQVLAAYRITSTITKDACFPERKEMTREFTAIVTKVGGKYILIDRDAAIVNPTEHTDYTLAGTFPGKTQIKDELSMIYGKYGVFSSRLDATMNFEGDKVTGTFTNHMDFKAGILGNLILDLWVQSYRAFEKAPVRVDSIPAITATPPCSLQGVYSGTRVEGALPTISPQLEINYIHDMRHAEELFPLSRLAEMNTLLEKITRYAPERPDAYWRLSRSYFVMSEHLDPEDQAGRLKYLAKAEAYGRQGIKADPQSGESWFFLTAALGRYATTKGILKAIQVTGELERGFLAAAAKKPRYNFAGFATAGDTQCGLGIYYRLVPDWWIVKVITGTRGDIDKAVAHLREALRYQPYRIEYNKELAVSLLCRGNRQKRDADIAEGLKVLQAALKLPTLLGTDVVDKRHMEELLQNYKNACGYSRDGYEDISEDAYSKIGAKPEGHPTPENSPAAK